tara:strand:+ start:265 stop:414 length:150 start_codon:yes stop_codon:yes gene_type:complete
MESLQNLKAYALLTGNSYLSSELKLLEVEIRTLENNAKLEVYKLLPGAY